MLKGKWIVHILQDRDANGTYIVYYDLSFGKDIKSLCLNTNQAGSFSRGA